MLEELLYADDTAKNTSTERKMQEAMDRISQACDNYDLKISTKKTEVVCQPAPGKLQWMDKDCKSLINSPILEALCLKQCTLMMRLLPELLKSA